MPVDIEQLWAQLGAVGLLIGFLSTAVFYMWRYIKKLTGQLLAVVERNSAAMTKLCTLIESNNN